MNRENKRQHPSANEGVLTGLMVIRPKPPRLSLVVFSLLLAPSYQKRVSLGPDRTFNLKKYIHL